jgi:hypothetical protein
MRLLFDHHRLLHTPLLLLVFCLLARHTAATLKHLAIVVDGNRVNMPVDHAAADMRHRAAAFCIEHGIGNLAGCARSLHEAAVEMAVITACAARSLMVVAHPDDETIFGLHTLMRASSLGKGGGGGGEGEGGGVECWTILCVTGGAESVKRAQFETAMHVLAASLDDTVKLERFEMWPYHDCISCVPFRQFAPTVELLEARYLDTIETDLLREVGRRSSDDDELHFFGKIVTHNQFGEYGHLQHRALHEQVSHAVRTARRKDTASLHVFQPITLAADEADPQDPRSAVLQAYPRLSSTLSFWQKVSARIVPIGLFDGIAAAVWCQEQVIPESSGMTLSCT